MDRLINAMKETINVSSRQEQVLIPKITPESWSIIRTCQEFKVSEHLERLESCGVKRDNFLNQIPQRGSKFHEM